MYKAPALLISASFLVICLCSRTSGQRTTQHVASLPLAGQPSVSGARLTRADSDTGVAAEPFNSGKGNARLPGSTMIQHIVVIFQENRTPDNLFHGLPNADIATFGINSKGRRITLGPQPLANLYDPRHRHADFDAMYDNGKMDGADKIPLTCNKHAKHCPPPNPQFKYVIPADVAPYFQMAEQYTFADRMFQTNQGPSFAAHQFIFSGTSAPTATSNLFAAEIPMGVQGSIFNTGCTAPSQEYVLNVDPEGRESSQQ